MLDLLLWCAVAVNLVSGLYNWLGGRQWRQFITQYQRYIERLEAFVLEHTPCQKGDPDEL